MSIEWPSDKVRDTFVSYFEKKRAHHHIPSSPVFPYDDPTLLFTNAGMNQFKPIFLGTVDPKSEQAKWKRAANSQKCIRAGGKHNDLDDVGKDTYHHTFFEMLGNWSFGDYFQEEAIDWAWDILVNTYGLNPERIYATFFKGDERDGLPADDKAKAIWGKYLPTERILPFGRKENFWEMGETGPCGPCTEIHFDRIGGRDASALVNADSPEVIEIWNLVFMAFNREESGKLTPLPAKHVDTGMGFERLTSILQRKMSNYDTDVFEPIFARITAVTGAQPYSALLGAADVDGRDTAYRIIADHIRTLTFALTDGAQPSDSGRGYVLRRILRRAVRAGKSFLKAPDGFFAQLVDVVVDKFGAAFPELRSDPARVKGVIAREEALFTRTLDKGLRRFEAIAKPLARGATLGGADAFLLYGTFGFPLDLVQIMSEERGLKVDLEAFHALLRRTREDSQLAYAAKKGENKFVLSAAAVAQLQKQGVAPTNDSPKYKLDEDLESAVRAIWKGSAEHGSFVPSVSGGEECGVVLDSTNFYAEGGGQMYDTGFLVAEGVRFIVRDSQVFGGFVAHIGVVDGIGSLNVGVKVACTVNNERRAPMTANHTGTHLLNLGLRSLVNSKAEQRGSVVSDERFRFDFDNAGALSRDQLFALDTFVNDRIAQRLPVYTREVALDEAKAIRGVRAMFGEAYPNPVRVVAVGADLSEVLKDKANAKWEQFAIEFCGGTHVANTADASVFTIVSEEPVSMGVRRVVAVTGDAAQLAQTEGKRLEDKARQLSALPDDDHLHAHVMLVSQEVDKATLSSWKKADIRALLLVAQERVKKVAKKKENEIANTSADFLRRVLDALKTSGAHSVVETLAVGNNRALSDTMVEIIAGAKKELSRDVAVCLLTLEANAKVPAVLVAASVPESLIAKGLKANEWVADVCNALGGKGGGSPKGDVAQGKGPNVDSLASALERAKKFAQGKL